ncbi:hypothetical protein Dimus_006975 [Dionaea muscipula]
MAFSHHPFHTLCPLVAKRGKFPLLCFPDSTLPVSVGRQNSLTMAAMRRLSRNLLTNRLPQTSNPNLPSPSLTLASSLISRRGIASKLFVGGISFHTTDKTLAEAFSQYGQVVEAKVVRDRLSEKSKGFGFVTFASEDEAHEALEEMNGKALQGRIIFVDYAKPQAYFSGGAPIARGPPEPNADG